jgi:mRNA-binding protein PUF3
MRSTTDEDSVEHWERLDELCAFKHLDDAPVSDSLEVDSSDDSTPVSRSARRRRGRRIAKAKAKAYRIHDTCNEIAILEPPSTHEQVVTLVRKEQLIRQLDAGGNQRRVALSAMKGSVLQMSLEPHGCRVVQTALATSKNDDALALVGELHGHVMTLAGSLHGNFVVQKAIEVFPAMRTAFVAEEASGHAAELARHRFGCRIFCRLVEQHLGGLSPAPIVALVNEVLSEMEQKQLIHHSFARHVVEAILEHGKPEHTQAVCQTILKNVVNNAKSRNASYVIEKAMRHCSNEDQEAIAFDLFREHESFMVLATHECGSHVVKAILTSHNKDIARHARERLLHGVGRLRSSKYGRKLLEEIEKQG